MCCAHDDPRADAPRSRVRRPAALAFLALWAAAMGLSAAGSARAEAIPGPPLESTSARAGDFCLPRGDAMGSGFGFATALAAIAIARRRSGGR